MVDVVLIHVTRFLAARAARLADQSRSSPSSPWTLWRAWWPACVSTSCTKVARPPSSTASRGRWRSGRYYSRTYYFLWPRWALYLGYTTSRSNNEHLPKTMFHKFFLWPYTVENVLPNINRPHKCYAQKLTYTEIYFVLMNIQKHLILIWMLQWPM